MEPFPESDYPADPYPGARPEVSFLHRDGHCEPLPDVGWRSMVPELAGRIPVLAYGSNACPAKIGWLRGHFGLTGPVVVLRARCHGLAAVWAAGIRARDGQRPATLAAEPGRTEWHAVWLATPDQVRVLDRCEGRGTRYRLVRLRTGTITLADGTELPQVLGYTGLSSARAPLLVSGRPVRCADVPQARAAALTGEPGPDGLTVEPVHGTPQGCAELDE